MADVVTKTIPATTIPAPPKGTGIFGLLWDQVSGFFVACFMAVWSGFADIIPKVTDSIFGYAAGRLNAAEDGVWEGIFQIAQQSSLLDRTTVERLLMFKGLPAPFNSIVNFLVLAGVLKEYLGTVTRATGSPTRWELNKMMRPELPFPAEILQAAFIAPEKTGEVREIFKKSGLSDESIDLLFIAAYRLYDVETVKTLWLRKKIDDKMMHERMRELGFTQTRINEIIQTWEIIPGPQDLFWMVGKEAFEPDAIAKMGLADEFPEEQVTWLEQQGISREWALKYWYAHWDQPSIQMGYDMLHRGVITMDELDMLFKTIEIPPYWRKKLIEINYVPFTRVDVRRMHAEGVITEAELTKAYMDIGYAQDKAEKLKEFTVKYNAKVGKDLNLSQVITGYKDKIINNLEASTYLQDMGYSTEEAKYLIDLEDYKDLKAFQDAQIDNIKKRYVGNFVDEYEARTMLNALNLPAVRTDALIETWMISRYEALKLPSKTDLDKFYLAGIIDQDTYVSEMFRLGYNSVYISWYFGLLSKKQAPTTET